MLCKIDEHGKPHKVMKMKKGKKEEVHVHEGDVFFASGKKKRKRRVMINNNTVYTVMAEKDGESKVRAEILNGPGKHFHQCGLPRSRSFHAFRMRALNLITRNYGIVEITTIIISYW